MNAETRYTLSIAAEDALANLQFTRVARTVNTLDTTPPIIDSLNVTAAATSITLTVSFLRESGIASYLLQREYALDGSLQSSPNVTSVVAGVAADGTAPVVGGWCVRAS